MAARKRLGRDASGPGCAAVPGMPSTTPARACVGPISPAANAAAVSGSSGASGSPVSARRAPSLVACSARSRASVLDRCTSSPTSAAVPRNPACAASRRESTSASASSITECTIHDALSIPRMRSSIAPLSSPDNDERISSAQAAITCIGGSASRHGPILATAPDNPRGPPEAPRKGHRVVRRTVGSHDELRHVSLSALRAAGSSVRHPASCRSPARGTR